MAFIDSTYFAGDIWLPSEVVSPANSVFTAFLNATEKKVLIDFFGYDLYKAFTAGLAAETPEQKWLDIRDGAEYTYNGITYKWIGLKNDDKKSMLAYFVYAEYVNNAATSIVAGGGEFAADFENSQRVGLQKPAQAYNNGLMLYGHEYSEPGQSLYDFVLTKNSENAETYPNWNFKYKEYLLNLG